LNGKVAIVTGGSKGLGLACVEEFLALGARVLIVSRKAEELEALCARLNGRYPAAADWVDADVSLDQGCAAVVQKALSLWGGVLDILVNNVGTNKRARVEETAEEDYLGMVRTNQDSAYFMCKRCLPLLRASSSPSVVNISSVAGIRSSGTGVAYAMTKAAMAHMSEALACEWASYGIRVNCVCPWMARTPLLEEAIKNDPGQLDRVCHATPLGRLGEPSDTGGAVAFLCMPAAAYITGQVVAVDGGLAAQGFRGPCVEPSSSAKK